MVMRMMMTNGDVNSIGLVMRVNGDADREE